MSDIAAVPTAPTTAADAPHRRRGRARFGIAFLAAFALLLSACLSAEQQSALDALNRDRAANGAAALGTQADAQAKAQAWAEKLARENTLYHSKLSDGINVRWCSLGENVGYGSSVAAVEAAFMRSPQHKPNIISRTWNGAGVGVAKNGSRVFVVQVFIKTC